LGIISTYRKSIKASTKNLSEARHFVAEHAMEHGFYNQQIEDIRLAVDEAITNIIKHAYRDDDSNDIEIEISFEEDLICIQIQDTGKSFRMDQLPEPNIEQKIKEKKRGGMGLYLIHSLMDEVRYSENRGINEMTMCKYRK